MPPTKEPDKYRVETGFSFPPRCRVGDGVGDGRGRPAPTPAASVPRSGLGFWLDASTRCTSLKLVPSQGFVFPGCLFLQASSDSQLANGDRGFENVELGVIGKKKKIPRRVIHFASGETMEEYSTDEEEDEQEKKDLLPPVDPTTLTWGPYLWFHMLRVATSTLSVCDFLGEKIASVLGISTPKYQYAIDEYYRMKREEEEEEQENKMSEEAERQHQEQQNKPQAEAPVQTDQPEATACTSFVNVNFENEGDCQSIGENKQDVVPVPP
ncbi:protein FAM177A1 [Egretta garzetta]|nr:protein FAM177A1 [Egretta garzetta]